MFPQFWFNCPLQNMYVFWILGGFARFPPSLGSPTGLAQCGASSGRDVFLFRDEGVVILRHAPVRLLEGSCSPRSAGPAIVPAALPLPRCCPAPALARWLPCRCFAAAAAVGLYAGWRPLCCPANCLTAAACYCFLPLPALLLLDCMRGGGHCAALLTV